MKNLIDEWQETKKNKILRDFLKKYGTKPAIKKEFGGNFSGLAELFNFNFDLAEKYGNLSLSLTILINQIILIFIDRFGSENIKKKYLKSAIDQGLMFSFAVSEPEVGPHPKYLKTRAHKKDGFYEINGTKTFISNASTCDYSLITAITSENEKKGYTIFILDMSDKKRIRCVDMKDLPFFKDSNHGTIFLESAIAWDILGEKDTAYEKIVLQFRKYEDILMSAPVLGSISYIFNKKLPKNSTDKKFLKKASLLSSSIEALKYLCRKSCEELENKNKISDHIHIFFRKEMKKLIPEFTNLCKDFSINLDKKDEEILNDLSATGNIAEKNAINKAIKLYLNKDRI